MAYLRFTKSYTFFNLHPYEMHKVNPNAGKLVSRCACATVFANLSLTANGSMTILKPD